MGKIALVFSGQGAQVPGMGLALSQLEPVAANIYRMADAIRPGTSRQCAQATKEELSLTLNAQPCLFCVDLAAAETLRAHGVVPDAVAGFSLGEIPALAFSGMMTHEAAFRLVCVRAEAMHACAQAHEGGMAAALGLSNEAIEEVCKATGAFPVNYNCPGQLVIAGERATLAIACDAIRAAGGRTMPLAVSGAFHSPLMKGAQMALERYVVGISLASPQIPVYSNASGMPYVQPYAENLVRQLASPVRWQETILHMMQSGITTFVEVGIGKTLSGLIKKIAPDAAVYQVETPESLAKTLEALNGGNEC